MRRPIRVATRPKIRSARARVKNTQQKVQNENKISNANSRCLSCVNPEE